MNFALPALLAFLIVLPGFLFRNRLKRAEQTSLDYSPFGRVVAEAMLWTIALHAIWLGIAWLVGQTLHPDALLGLLSSAPDLQKSAVADVSTSASHVFLNFVSLYAFALVVPTALRVAITHWRLDRFGAPFSAVFRFYGAPWYYLLTGADFEAADEPDYISIAALVEVAGDAVLYVGILTDFFFDPDGQLDRLVLENVSRRPISRDKTGDDAERFYAIEGDYFVIRYADVVTLNVHYFKLEVATDAAEMPVGPDSLR